MTEDKKELLQVYLDSSEKKWIEYMAAKDERSVSSWSRIKLLRGYKKEDKQ